VAHVWGVTEAWHRPWRMLTCGGSWEQGSGGGEAENIEAESGEQGRGRREGRRKAGREAEGGKGGRRQEGRRKAGREAEGGREAECGAGRRNINTDDLLCLRYDWAC
jgi:hypothetical protein